MRRAAIAPACVAALLGSMAAAGARAQALDACTARSATSADVAACLQIERRAATDAMLEAFLAVQRAARELDQVTGRATAEGALQDSQRAFERQLAADRPLVQRLMGTGAARAQLACEVDALRARAAWLARLAPARP